MEEKDFKVGYSFKFGRTIYTIVAVFEDLGKTYYVGRKPCNSIYEYSHIFCFRNDGTLMKRS